MSVIRGSWLLASRSLSAVFLCFASIAANAVVLVQWDPAGTIQSSTPLAPSAVSPDVSAGNLTLGPGLTNPGAFANAFVGDNWPAGALDATDYLSFSITGDVTYQSVVFSLYNNFDGAGNWELRSSADAFASAIASGTFTGIFGGGLVISADVSALGTRNGAVEFRLYTYNNSGTTNPLQRGIRGTAGGGGGLMIDGTAGGGTPPVVAALAVPTLSAAILFALIALVGFAGFATISTRRKRKA
jgi:hypothetical protein